jgi:hypothetical protein
MCLPTDGGHGAASLCSVPAGDAGGTRRDLDAGSSLTLSPSGEPLRQTLQDGGDHILDTLQGLRGVEQLDFACNTVRDVRLEDQPPALNRVGVARGGGEPDGDV